MIVKQKLKKFVTICALVGALTGCPSKVEQAPQKKNKRYENPCTSTVYDRITNQAYTDVLEEIKVDHCGDGRFDEVIAFGTRDSSILSENCIRIYDDFVADEKEKEYIKLPRNIRSDEEYRIKAAKILKERGYPTGMLKGFRFFRHGAPK